MALLLVGLLTAGACGGVFFLLQPKWQTHQSVQGGFEVELPAEPRNDMEEIVKADANKAQNVRIEGTILLLKLEEYSVVYAEIDDPIRRLTDEKILDRAVKGLEDDDPGVELFRDVPMTVAGFPAREVSFSHADGGTYVGRIIVAETRLYILTAGGPNMDGDGNKRTKRFLDSFRITDVRLLAKQKERQAIQQLARQGAAQARQRSRDRNRKDD
jgi:hypothetical protein